MSEIAARYRTMADQFEARVTAVAADAWENPSPCEGWVARDVVRHVVDTTGFFLGGTPVAPPAEPSVDDDPVGAWRAARAAVQAALEDPAVAQLERDTGMGAMTVEALVDRFGIVDLLVHTWDLARAAGLDEALDADEVARYHAAMLPTEEMMRASGAFGPAVEVPEDADPQTRFLAFLGRRA